MRVFVDVGAHYGETLDVALDPQWAFDLVYSLEPAPQCARVLAGFRDPRLRVQKIALSNRSGTAPLYGSGLLGGSLYADKPQYEHAPTKMIDLERASDWFRKNIPEGADVFVKLNCEGSEADILEDLLDSGEIEKVTAFYVDFDIRKIPSQAHRQDQLEARLREKGVKFLSTADLGLNANWGLTQALHWVYRPVRAPLRRSIAHRLHFYAPPYERMKRVIGGIVPNRAYWWLGRKFGRMTRMA
jgi:FkbM family methyltransferase